MTDRRNALGVGTGPRGITKIEDWTVRYLQGPGFHITFDFNKSYSIHELGIVYTGNLPGLEILASDDEVRWKNIGASGPAAVRHVDNKKIKLEPTKGRYLKIKFAERKTALTLSEIEVWGKSIE